MIDSKNFECTGFANLNSGTLNSGWKFVFIIDNSILTEELAILYPENGLYMTCGEYSPTAWKYLYAGIVTT